MFLSQISQKFRNDGYSPLTKVALRNAASEHNTDAVVASALATSLKRKERDDERSTVVTSNAVFDAEFLSDAALHAFDGGGDDGAEGEAAAAAEAATGAAVAAADAAAAATAGDAAMSLPFCVEKGVIESSNSTNDVDHVQLSSFVDVLPEKSPVFADEAVCNGATSEKSAPKGAFESSDAAARALRALHDELPRAMHAESTACFSFFIAAEQQINAFIASGEAEHAFLDDVMEKMRRAIDALRSSEQ